jgi:hypothetical protein
VKVATEYCSTPGLWSAHFPDLYDGAPDAGPQLVGYGEAEIGALVDLMEQAIEHFETLAYAEGRKDEREEMRKEQILRAMNETGQGEHGVTA